MIQKDTLENASAMQVDPGAAGLHQTPCAICTSEIREVPQLRSLAADLHTFSTERHDFLVLYCLLACMSYYMLINTDLTRWQQVLETGRWKKLNT